MSFTKIPILFSIHEEVVHLVEIVRLLQKHD